MSNVIDYFENLRVDPDAAFWISMEIKEANGDESRARLAVWRGLLLCREYQMPYFSDSRRVVNGL